MFPITRFKIEEKSMEPNFKSGDYVLVVKRPIYFSHHRLGDVIVFKHPKEKNKFLIKRISVVTNSDEYYVVGDNENFSQDSRHFGTIKKNLIVGKVFFCVKA